MSKEIGPYPYQTGVTDLKGVLRNAAGQVRNVSGASIDTFEAWADGSIDDYDFALAEDGTSGDYYADLPAGLLASVTYHVTPFRGTATMANYRNTKETGCLVGPGNDGVFVAFEGINNDSFAENAIDSWAIAPDAVQEIQAGLAAADELIDSDNKLDQLIALFQQGLPDVGPAQQRGHFQIVKGDTYGAGARLDLTITKAPSASWPDDLDDWVWTLHTVIHPDNANVGALVGDIEVVTPTGASRSLRMAFSSAESGAAAVGKHLFAIRGQEISSPSSGVERRPVIGAIEAEDNYE